MIKKAVKEKKAKHQELRAKGESVATQKDLTWLQTKARKYQKDSKSKQASVLGKANKDDE